MENIEQPQQPQYIEQQVPRTKNPYKLIVIFLSIIIVILLVSLVFLFLNVMTLNKNIGSQQQVSNTTQINSDKTNDLSVTTVPSSVTTVQDKSFILADYGGVSSISFTYPENWTLKQANQQQRSGWGAQLISPSNKLTVWMGNASDYLGVAGLGCEKSLGGYDTAKITYYNTANIEGISGYKLYTVISDDGKNRIYDSFVGSKSIDDYAIERNKDMRCAINGGGIKGKLIDTTSGVTSNLYIKIIIDGLNGQSAESEQVTTQTANYIKTTIESDEYQQAKKIIMSARMN